MDSTIIGHKKQLEFLDNAREREKLAHAYIFAGPEGVGKKMVARKLALELLGQVAGDQMHPDLIEVDGVNGIKIEQIRELVYKLSLKPYSSQHKVAIINDAHEMTTEAANGLLKSLEEPKPNTIIILITSNAYKLPKTILSRSQKINFGTVEIEREKTEEAERSNQWLEVLKTGQLEDKLILAYEIADLETSEIKKTFEMWLGALEKELLIRASKNLAQKISAIGQSYKFLDQNVNTKLLLTNLMINT